MVGTTVGGADPTQRVGPVCKLFQLGAEESAAVDAGASLSGDLGVICQDARQRRSVAGLVEEAGGPVPLVQAGLAYRWQRWDSPLLVGEKAQFSSGPAAVKRGSRTAGG